MNSFKFALRPWKSPECHHGQHERGGELGDLGGHCVGWLPIMYNQRKTMLEVEILKGRKNEFIVKGCCNKM